MLGRLLHLPIDEEQSLQLTTSYAGHLFKNLGNTRRFVPEHLQLISDRMKECYDSSTQEKIFERGDAVWLFNPQRKKGVTPKLSCNWKELYTVVKHINDDVYKIQHGPRTKPTVVHRNRLWKYCRQSTPTWLNAT